MAAPKFGAVSTVANPFPGQVIHVDVFSSVDMLAPPTVVFDGIRSATFVTQLGIRSWRYSFTVSVFDTGAVQISGTAITLEPGTIHISNLFSVRYAGDPEVPFGAFPFGYSGFGLSIAFPTLPPPSIDPDDPPPPPEDPPTNLPPDLLCALYRVSVRRGWEGPQVVGSWENPGSRQVRVLRRELDWPAAYDDVDSVVVYDDIGTSVSDIAVKDATIYYYSVFMERLDGEWVRICDSEVLVIDNQPVTDWLRITPVLSATTSAQPATPAAGDRYLLPAGSAGAEWVGNDFKIAEWDGAQWVFTDPKHLLSVAALDTESFWVYRLTAWVEAVDKQRFSLYDLLEGFDIEEDQLSATVPWGPLQSSALDNEQFNFDVDPTRGRPTERRVLKNFDLPLNEMRGLVDHICDFYDARTMGLSRLLSAGALVGYDDYTGLPNPQRRFLINEMAAAHYPRVGSREAVAFAVSMWLGTEVSFERRDARLRVFKANRSKTPVIDPVPNDSRDTLDDTLDKTPSFTWNTLRHYRAVGLWFDKPFNPLTFLPQGTVLSAVMDVPAAPADGDRYVVPAGATGAWVGQDGRIATWDAGGPAWVFEDPEDRWSVLAEDDLQTYVFRGGFPGGTWTTALDPEGLIRLEWWLRSYAMPGTAYFAFREYDPAA